MFKLYFTLLLLFTSSAPAYFVGVPAGQAPLRYDEPVRVLLSGLGDNFGGSTATFGVGKSSAVPSELSDWSSGADIYF